LIDASSQWPAEFTITYTDDELRSYRKIVATRYARGDGRGWIFVIPFLGLVVLGAFELGFVAPTTVRSVLVTTYAAFTLGAASYYILMRRHFHKFARNEGWRGRPWHWCFDETGIRYWCETTDVRLAWSALDRVEDLGSMIFLRIGWRAFCIPSRVFPDDAARASFVAATAIWIKAAAEKARGLPDPI
jgi:YcxB-like protein